MVMLGKSTIKEGSSPRKEMRGSCHTHRVFGIAVVTAEIQLHPLVALLMPLHTRTRRVFLLSSCCLSVCRAVCLSRALFLDEMRQEADGQEESGPVKPMKDLSIAEGQKVHLDLKARACHLVGLHD